MSICTQQLLSAGLHTILVTLATASVFTLEVHSLLASQKAGTLKPESFADVEFFSGSSGLRARTNHHSQVLQLL